MRDALLRLQPRHGRIVLLAMLAAAMLLLAAGRRFQSAAKSTVTTAPSAALAEVDASAAALRMDDPERHFPSRGFVEMVPAIQPPIRADRSNRVTVWLYVPPGRSIEVELRDGRALLRYPEGTDSARVESVSSGDPRDAQSFAAGDVRGTRFEAGGRELFYVYRPRSRTERTLFGFQWHRDDPTEERAALAGILRTVEQLRAGRGTEEALRRVRTQNACPVCHVPSRADNFRPRELGVVNRGTDAGGFFLVPSVLSSEAPLEAYEPHNPALESPFVTVFCAAGEPLLTEGEVLSASCPDGGVPRARLDLRRALASGDEHARRVCAARRHLLEHMSPAARGHFVAAAAECTP